MWNLNQRLCIIHIDIVLVLSSTYQWPFLNFYCIFILVFFSCFVECHFVNDGGEIAFYVWTSEDLTRMWIFNIARIGWTIYSFMYCKLQHWHISYNILGIKLARTFVIFTFHLSSCAHYFDAKAIVTCTCENAKIIIAKII
jgi:hypothetical protein